MENKIKCPEARHIFAINQIIIEEFEDEKYNVKRDVKTALNVRRLIRTITIPEFGFDMFPLLTDKAGFLFFYIVKEKPFRDGNKRTAIALLRYFLKLNSFNLYDYTEENDEELYIIIKQIEIETILTDRYITYWLKRFVSF